MKHSATRFFLLTDLMVALSLSLPMQATAQNGKSDADTAISSGYFGSVSILKSEELAKMAPVSVESTIQGLVSGVQVNGNNGVPGSVSQIIIRGIKSISSGTAPLWIIDGMPVQSDAIDQTFDGESQQSVLGLFNVNDIESIQVLKDAAATSIYGIRGANGVIVVTTKSGKKGGLKLNLDVRSGFSNWTKTDIGLANSSEWFQIAEMANQNTNNTAYDVTSTYQGLSNMTLSPTLADAKNTDTDWVKQISRTGSFYEAGLSLSQGTDNYNTYASFKYRKDNGNLKWNDLETFSGNVKFNSNIANLVDVSYRLAAAYSDNNRIKSYNGKTSAGGWGMVNSCALPWFEVKDAASDDGYWNSLAAVNPVANMDPANSTSGLKTTNLLSVLNISANLPVEGLKLKADWGMNYVGSNAESWRSQNICPNGEILDEQKNTMFINDIDAYFSYFRNLNSIHEISAVAGIESNRKKAEYAGIKYSDLSGNPVSDSEDERYLFGYYLNSNYKLMNRYIVNAGIRRDGVSTFSKDNRWATFHSIGLGWIMSDESWFNIGAMNYLKLHTSMGQTGNADIPTTYFKDRWKVASGTGRSLVGNNSCYLNTIGNSDLRWETTTSFDAGISFGLLDSRISGSVVFYRQNVKDMIMSVRLPYSAGVRSDSGEGQGNFGWMNTANMYNQGVEFDFNASIISSKDLTWTVGFNISHNSNKITGLDTYYDAIGEGIKIEGEGYQVRTIMKAGHSFGTYYMAEYAGVDSEKGIPMIYEVATDDNGETSRTGNIIPATSTNMDNNRMILDGKSALPKFTGGFNTTVKYHGFDIYALFAFSGGNYIYSCLRQSAMTPGTLSTALDRKLLTDSWKQAGDNTDIPQVSVGNKYYYGNDGSTSTTAVLYGDRIKTPSSRFLEKADFLKLRNFTVGYTFPVGNEQSIVKGLRVYLSGSNLFTFSGFSGYDPEIAIDSSTGGSIETFGAMPSTRTFSIGANINF